MTATSTALPPTSPAQAGTQGDLQRNTQSGHIPGLDGLRAVAVFLVIFNH